MAKMRRLAALLLVAGVTALTFARSLRNEPVWDDVDLVIRNPYLRSFRGLVTIVQTDIWSASAKGEASSFYRPIPMMSYMIDAALGAGAPAAFHAGNAALHLVAALLLFRVVEQRLALGRDVLTGGGAPGDPPRARSRVVPPAIAALWFAVAPVNHEPVAWISGRFDVLGVVFVLLAFVANARPSRGAALAAAGSMVGATFCKEAFITGAALLALDDVLVHRRSIRGVRVATGHSHLALKYASWGVGIAVFFALRAVAGVMSVTAVTTTGFATLLASYAFLLATYARVLVFPAYLDPFRPYAPLPAVGTLAVLVATVLAFGVAARAARRRDDPAVRLVALGLGWVLVAFAPSTLTGPNLDMVGDRYAYFPLIGAFLVAGALADALARTGGVARVSALSAAGMCLAVYARGTALRLADWHDDRTLYAKSLADNPQNAYALYAIGYLDALEGRIAEADPMLVRSLALQPRSWRTLDALCYVRLQQKRWREAARLCTESAALNPMNSRTWVNLASVHVNTGRWPQALDAATRAEECKPAAAEPHYLRAVALANLGVLEEAGAELAETLRIEPQHAGAKDLARQFRAHGLPP